MKTDIDNFPRKAGVYKIYQISTSKTYVGSSINLQSRLRKHLRCLIKNDHANQKLQNSWNKYGQSDFRTEVLEIT